MPTVKRFFGCVSSASGHLATIYPRSGIPLATIYPGSGVPGSGVPLRFTLGRGFRDLPWVGGSEQRLGPPRYDLPWVGGSAPRFDLPWVGGSARRSPTRPSRCRS